MTNNILIFTSLILIRHLEPNTCGKCNIASIRKYSALLLYFGGPHVLEMIEDY